MLDGQVPPGEDPEVGGAGSEIWSFRSGENEKLGLDGEYVSVSVNDTTKALFTAEQLAQVDQIIADIISGAIDPGTAFGQAEGWFYDEFVASMQ